MTTGLLPKREWLKVDEISEFLSCSPRHVRRLAERGKLIAFRIGEEPASPLRIQRASVVKYIHEMREVYEFQNGIVD